MEAGQLSQSLNKNSINKSIIWLDTFVNDIPEYLNAQQLFRSPTNHLKTYTDDKECEKYIRNLSKTHRVILIVGNRIGHLIVPRIHQLIQISAIFIYCIDQRNEQWTKTYKKIKGVIEEINELVIQVLSVLEKQTSHDRFESSLPITIYHTNGTQEQSTSELNGQFVHSQILIDCLLRMKTNSQDKIEFINYCKKEYAKDHSQLNIIKEFEQTYQSNNVLTWYTRDCFLYRLLNKTLRIINIDLLYLFGFIIRDLYQQLKQYQYSVPINIYRGQLMSIKEVEQLEKSVGQLISMNSFVSTTLDRDVAIIFSGDTGLPSTNNFQPVLFEIQADPSIMGIKPFADITPFSSIDDEEEILMMLGTIFRIVHIRYDGHLCVIQLELCSENNHDVKTIFDQMKEDYHGDGHTNPAVFGIVLANMGKYEEAERYLNRLLDEPNPRHETTETNVYNLSVYYVNLGNVAGKKGDYNKSLELHQRALEIRLQLKRSNDPSIADIYNLIGGDYLRKADYGRALESFNQALNIYQQVYGEDHTKIAEVFTNIGSVYFKQEKYSQAIEYHNKVLAIQKNHLHENHYLLGVAHTNIATSYLYSGNKKLALKHFNEALKIFEKCLPAQHPDFAVIYNNMGGIYVEQRDLEQALSCFEKAAAILHQTVGPNHPDYMNTQTNIQYIRSYIHKPK